MKSAAELIDFFIADSIKKSDDRHLMSRARVVAGISVLYFISVFSTGASLSLFILLGNFDIWMVANQNFFAAFLYVIQIIYFKKSGNIFISAMITLSIILLGTISFIAFSGGWESPLTIFLFIIPMCAFLMLGYKTGFLWSGIAVLAYIGFGVLHYFKIPMLHLVPSELYELFRFFMWIYTWSIAVGVVFIFSWILNTLNDSINSERNALKIKTSFDEETGLYNRKAFDTYLLENSTELGSRSALKSIIFVEISSDNPHADKKEQDELFKTLLQKIRIELQDSAALCRYGINSLSMLLSGQEHVEQARGMIEHLYQYLSLVMNEHGGVVTIGATIAPGGTNDIHTLNQTSRRALHQAKKQARRVCIQTIGIKTEQTDRQDYQHCVTSYSALLARNSTAAKT